MKALGEEFEEAFIFWLIAPLQRIDKDEAAAWPQYPGEFTEDNVAHAGRHFVKGKDARHRVLAFVGHRNRFSICNDKVDPRPTLQMTLRFFHVRL